MCPADAKCVSLSDNKSDGLAVVHPDSTNVLVPFRENVTLTCSSTGRVLRKTASAGFRQCVYDPKPVSVDKHFENTVESRCLPLTVTDKTIMKIRFHFQYKMPVEYQNQIPLSI